MRLLKFFVAAWQFRLWWQKVHQLRLRWRGDSAETIFVKTLIFHTQYSREIMLIATCYIKTVSKVEYSWLYIFHDLYFHFFMVTISTTISIQNDANIKIANRCMPLYVNVTSSKIKLDGKMFVHNVHIRAKFEITRMHYIKLYNNLFFVKS